MVLRSSRGEFVAMEIGAVIDTIYQAVAFMVNLGL